MTRLTLFAAIGGAVGFGICWYLGRSFLGFALGVMAELAIIAGGLYSTRPRP